MSRMKKQINKWHILDIINYGKANLITLFPKKISFKIYSSINCNLKYMILKNDEIKKNKL